MLNLEISALFDYLQNRWSSSEIDEIVNLVTTCAINPGKAKPQTTKSKEDKPQFTFE